MFKLCVKDIWKKSGVDDEDLVPSEADMVGSCLLLCLMASS